MCLRAGLVDAGRELERLVVLISGRLAESRAAALENNTYCLVRARVAKSTNRFGERRIYSRSSVRVCEYALFVLRQLAAENDSAEPV